MKLWNVIWNSTATAPGDHTIQFIFNDKLINYQQIWIKFSQHIKYLLFIYSL